MPWFKYGDYLQRCDDSCYDVLHASDAWVVFPGIYQCNVCQGEVARDVGSQLPRHEACVARMGTNSGVGWRMLAFADSKPKWAGILTNPAWPDIVPGADEARGER